MKKILIIFGIILLIGSQLSAQTVTGTVSDASSGETLPGVNITVKGTTTGTSTDENGHYELEVESLQDTLTASFVGFQTREISISGRTTVDILLSSQVLEGEEMVVVGYGTQRKKDVTGSVSSVNSEDLESASLTSPEQALQGRVAGVQVRRSGGDLQGNFQVNIRGVGSTGNTQPLYVVDGVPLFSSSLSTINSDDIESVEVLKDASASAIYGARASNGVVIITTKSGNPGKTEFSINAEYGVSRVSQTKEVVNSQQHAELFREGFNNAGVAPPPEIDDPDFLQRFNNDWVDLVTQLAPKQEYNLTATGGNEATQFAVSGRYKNETGVIVDTGIQQVSLRVNVDHEVNSWLKVGATATGNSQWWEDGEADHPFNGPFRSAHMARPWIPHKNEDGSFATIPPRTGAYFGYVNNPVARVETQIRDRSRDRVLGNAYTQFDISDNLQFKSTFGTDLLFSNNYTYLPVWNKGGLDASSTGTATKRTGEDINWVTDHTLTYTDIFGENHNVEGVVGFTAQKFTTDFLLVRASGTTNNDLREIGNQPNVNAANGGGSQAGLVSYFARANYDYKSKYLLTATIRRDGSSRFGPGNRVGTFPSGSIGWRISEETFMQNVDWLNDFKIRASYGLTGNQSIGNFQFLARASSANYAFGNSVVEGNAPVSFANPNLQWESSEQLDIGIDLSLFDNRISFTADYYDKKSNDLLVNIPVPPANGITNSETLNLGQVQNTGVEFSLTSYNISTREFTWSTNFNIATNKNEVIDIGQDARGNDLEVTGATLGPPFRVPINLTTAGEPIGSFYGYIFDGIWQKDEASEAAEFGLEPGDSKFRDLNNDGNITTADRTFIGHPQPDIYGGMSHNFSYKAFALSASFYWQYGHQLLNTLDMYIENGNPNIRKSVDYFENRWTPDSPSNEHPRIIRSGRSTENARIGTQFVEDASFLRLQNITLSYNLPTELLTKVGLSGAAISLTGTNLATLTNYEGIDPENNSNGSPLSAGLDITPYPPATTFSVGLNIDF